MSAAEALCELILAELEKEKRIDSYDFSVKIGKDHQSIVGAIKSIRSLGDVSSLFHRSEPKITTGHWPLQNIKPAGHIQKWNQIHTDKNKKRFKKD